MIGVLKGWEVTILLVMLPLQILAYLDNFTVLLAIIYTITDR